MGGVGHAKGGTISAPRLVPPRHPSIARALGQVREALRPVLGRCERPLRLVVACSGGPDSVALLGLLHLLAGPEQLRLYVSHCDHGLRPESVDEAALVRSLAARLDLPVGIDTLRLQPGPGAPVRARRARRRALRARADAFGADFVALGHTATDQAESVLLHLIRGTGLDGLGGMAPISPFDCEEQPPSTVDPARGFLRPLLGLTRDQTRALAMRLELPFVDDPSNADPRHPRVRIRNEVLPILAGIREGTDLAIADAAGRVREGAQALQAWVERELMQRREGEHWRVADIATLPRAVRTRFVRTAGLRCGVDPDALGRRTLAMIDAALCEQGPARGWDLRPRRRLHLRDGRLWVTAEHASDSESRAGSKSDPAHEPPAGSER